MPKRDPLTSIGEDITAELTNDAPIVAQQLFGDQQYDAKNIPDHQMAMHITNAYRVGNRDVLTKLAMAGPEQFLRVWKSLGGTIPPRPTEQQG